jgi:hypothetical protein
LAQPIVGVVNTPSYLKRKIKKKSNAETRRSTNFKSVGAEDYCQFED